MPTRSMHAQRPRIFPRAAAPLLALLALALLGGCHARGCTTLRRAALRGATGANATSPAPRAHAYVADDQSNDVAVVDLASTRVAARIAVGGTPRALAVAGDGSALYVARSASPRLPPRPGAWEAPPPQADAAHAPHGTGLVRIDTATGKVARFFDDGQSVSAVALSHDGATVFVAEDAPPAIAAFDAHSGELRVRVPLADGAASALALQPGRETLLVALADGDAALALGTKDLAVRARVATGKKPRAVLFATDGAVAFVANELSASVTVVDTQSWARVADIELHLDSPMPSGVRPSALALSPDGRTLYVASGRGGSVAVVDVARRVQVRSLEGVGDAAVGLAVTDDGARIVTANGTSHDVSIVDIATGNVTKRVAVGGLPTAVVLTR